MSRRATCCPRTAQYSTRWPSNPSSGAEPSSKFSGPRLPGGSLCRTAGERRGLRRQVVVDSGTSLLRRSLASLSRWGAVEAGTVDPEVVEEGDSGFVGAFDEELGEVEVEG